MITAVTIIYGIVAFLLIVVVLIQAGRGGGMGVALGGGATQSVFGGSGGADFMAKLTYGLAAGFMLGALFLAYSSAHTGSSRLQDESEALAAEELLADEGEEVNYERIGPNPLPLPQPGAAPPALPEPEEAEVGDEAPAEGEEAPGEDGVEAAEDEEAAAEPAEDEPPALADEEPAEPEDPPNE
jgi:preprotein translocase subunit SecG